MDGEKALTSRQLQAQKTKQRLIDTGTELIKSSQYDAITIEDITDMCGLSKGTFYSHFKSKDQFFYSICRTEHDALISIFDDTTCASHLERLRRFCEQWILQQQSSSVYFIQNWFAHLLDSEYHESVGYDADQGSVYKVAVKKCLAEAQVQGELFQDAPIDELADYAIVILYGMSARDVMTRRKLSLVTWSKMVADSYVDDILFRYRPGGTSHA